MAPALKLFDTPISSYSASELNDALYTLFGELSANLHDALQREAEAIASTIFNRHQNIIDKRKMYDSAKKAEEQATRERNAALKAYEDITRFPTSTKKMLSESGVKQDQVAFEYNKLVKTKKDAYDVAREALGDAQTARIKANSEKIQAESFVAPGARNRAVTLSDIVTAPGPNGTAQYEGYAPGKQLYQKYGNLSAADQQRNEKRWTTVRAALTKLASDPTKRLPYIEFRSNRGGTRQLKANETRIGGNDFW